MKKALALLLALTMVLLVFAGCASQNDTEEPPAEISEIGATDESKDTTTDEANTEEETTSEDKYGGVLVYSPGVQSEQNLGYPAGDTNMLTTCNAAPALESLVRMDTQGNIVCWLAESYETSEDGLTYTFHIRQGVTFHDGTPLNAEAVAWNIQMCVDNGKPQYARVESVETTDEYTVVIHMSQPDLLLLSNMAADPSGLIISPTSFEENGAEWAEKNPVGTGPFVFESWENDVEAVYTRNENYWGVDSEGNQLPYLDGVRVVYMAETAVTEAALEAGDIQLWLRADADSLVKFNGKEGFIAEKAAVPSCNYNLVPCTQTDNPAANKAFREAFRYAVDFETIVDSLFGVNSVATNQNSVPGRVYYNEDITTYEYDPEKAREKLAEAGYADGVEINLYAENAAVQEKMLTAMVPYLEEVGITANVQLLDTGGFFTMMTSDFQDGFLVGGYNYSPDEFGKMYSLASASAAMPVNNYSMDEATYQLFEDARSCTSQEEAAEIVKELQEQIYGTNLYLISIMTQFEAMIRTDSVQDSGFYLYSGYHWTPETAYLSK